MRPSYVTTLAAVVCIAPLNASYGQQSGSTQTFGADGRLFSSGRDDYFLLSARPEGNEDATGYVGQVRIVRHYEGGGYQIFIKDYSAWCRSLSGALEFVWSTPGDTASAQSETIANPNKRPDTSLKETYNLYWAVCRGQFRKFK